MMNLKKLLVPLCVSGVLLSACAQGTPATSGTSADTSAMTSASSTTASTSAAVTSGGTTQAAGHGSMGHDESGEIPEGLKKAESPAFPEGSKVTLQADHMPGMNGAEATIVGAFDTIAYAVTFTPTTGGEPVENHKWVIHEELKEAAEARPLAPGTKVTLEARHMTGMEGAQASIDSNKAITVYMVDFKATDTGETIRNHQWLTEDEISAAK